MGCTLFYFVLVCGFCFFKWKWKKPCNFLNSSASTWTNLHVLYYYPANSELHSRPCQHWEYIHKVMGYVQNINLKDWSPCWWISSSPSRNISLLSCSYRYIIKVKILSQTTPASSWIISKTAAHFCHPPFQTSHRIIHQSIIWNGWSKEACWVLNNSWGARKPSW